MQLILNEKACLGGFLSAIAHGNPGVHRKALAGPQSRWIV
jgi:hypothetical protein